MEYTVYANGYKLRTLRAINEVAAKQQYARLSGWLSDDYGYSDFVSSVRIVSTSA